MRKICTLLVVFVLFATTTKAQYVNVNDGPFKTWLMYYYPSCFNVSEQLDTTCTQIITEDSLVFSGFDYADMLEIKYFKTLRYLKCYSNSNLWLTSIPQSVRHFDWSGNVFSTYSGPLPDSLEFFDISDNAFTVMPVLPALLDTFICASQLEPYSATPSLHSLNPLPNGLKYFDCSGNSINTLPLLPDSLKYFDCRGQYQKTNPGSFIYILGSLPSLPDSLKVLKFGGNIIASIPPLPASLEYLDCSHQVPGLVNENEGPSPITSLPPLPSTLNYLDCSRNRITSLPALPAGLVHLNIKNNNYITELPQLPQALRYLNIVGNPGLHCIPYLPASMALLSPYPFNDNANLVLDLSYLNGVKCLPNSVQGMIVGYFDSNGWIPYTPPLCSPVNNLYGCQFLPVISGTTFYDNNSNGIQETGELPKPNVRVELSNGLYGFSNNSGYYELSAGIGSNTLTVDPVTYYDPVPSTFTHNFTTYDTLVTDLVAMQPNTMIDSMAIVLVPLNTPRPGFTFHYTVDYENVGTTVVNPHIVLTYDNTKMSYTGSSNAAVTNSGNTLTLDLTGFAPGHHESFMVDFHVAAAAVLGDTLRGKVVCTSGTDICTDSVYSIIRGAYDPNDKWATPKLTVAQVQVGKYIDYLVRFQNTGSFAATNIVITDTLSGLLQANSLEMIRASHNCKITQHGNAIVFEFLNIMLPWAASNEPASHGYIRFRVKPLASSISGLQIDNRVRIYFDFNSPVLTNIATTTITSAPLPLSLLSFKAYLNDNNSALLNWTTANEINTRSFDIEQSVDGRNFKFISGVPARGRGDNSYMQQVNLPADVSYYRLKMIDIDGKFSYSPIIKISVNKNASGLVLMGNPVKESLLINVTGKSVINTNAIIINNLRAVVKTVLLKEGLQNIDVSELAAGNYFIKTNSGSQKFIINR